MSDTTHIGTNAQVRAYFYGERPKADEVGTLCGLDCWWVIGDYDSWRWTVKRVHGNSYNYKIKWNNKREPTCDAYILMALVNPGLVPVLQTK